MLSLCIASFLITITHSPVKQPISSTHLKVSPRLLTRVKDKRQGENLWVQESYSESHWENSKRTWLKFSSSDFGLYILLIGSVTIGTFSQMDLALFPECILSYRNMW